MKIIAGALLACSLAAGMAVAGETPTPSTENEKINYSVGYQLGGDFRKQGVALDPAQLVQGIRDAADDGAPKMTEKEMRQTLVALKANITAAERKRKSGLPAVDPAAEAAFLAANGKKEGVVTLPGGLQYRIIKEGAGKSPTADDNVLVNSRGSLIDGKEFYNSRKTGEPLNIQVGKMVAGLKEVLLRMNEGAHWQAFIPPELGYRKESPLEGKTVIFDIEMLKVVPKPADR